MNMTDVYGKVFGDLRELGFTKMFEDTSIQFFMQIAATPHNPITKDKTVEDIKNMDLMILPSWEKDYLLDNDIFREGDSIRWHQFVLNGDIAGVYFIILNDGLEGRGSIEHKPAIVRTTKYLEAAEDGSTGPYKMNALILFGDKAPQVTDVTRGLILKHELAHIILEYITGIVEPTFFDKQVNELNETDPELAKQFNESCPDFIEFLCDFVQYDSNIVNKFTRKPTQKFCDAEELLFNKETIEKYRPFVTAVDQYFQKLDNHEVATSTKEA